MVITPSSAIYLLKNVPLNNTYDHTIRFTSLSAQQNYFSRADLRVATFTNQTYQRYAKGKIRVQALADNLYNCNYLMFQNTAHGIGKWFYAFVTSVEYINENVTELTYEIDVIQTYMFDISFGYCFVEREHTETDTRNDWLVPENLATGDYIIQSRFGWYPSLKIRLTTTYDLSRPVGTLAELAFEGYNTTQGVYMGVGHLDKDANTSGGEELNKILDDYAEYTNGILNCEISPDICDKGKVYDHDTGVISGHGTEEKSIPIPFQIDGHTIRNKKLLSFPYCFLAVDDNLGHQALYQFEHFITPNSDTAKFIIFGNYIPQTTIWCVPEYYKSQRSNLDEALISSGYPTCAINCDTYKAWCAQNKNTITTQYMFSALNGAISSGVGIAGSFTGNPILMGAGARRALSAYQSIKTLDATIKDKSNFPYQASGKASGDSTPFALSMGGLQFYTKTITKTMADVIDSYFDMFGYAVKQVKKPNIFDSAKRKRPHWNYIKTVNCDIVTNNCPADDTMKIKEIHDNGITYWEHADEIGNYSLNNSPT